jgi:hypothetical protein
MPELVILPDEGFIKVFSAGDGYGYLEAFPAPGGTLDFSGYGFDFAYTPGRWFMAGGGAGSGLPSLLRSTDGKIWLEVDEPRLHAEGWRAIVYDPGDDQYIVAGFRYVSHIAARSLDGGVTWLFDTDLLPLPGPFVTDVIKAGSLYVSAAFFNSSFPLQTSVDGQSWTDRALDAAFGTFFPLSLAYSPSLGRAVLVGVSTTGKHSGYSTDDGVTWVASTTPILPAGGSAIWSESRGLFIATAGGTQVATSADGDVWASTVVPGVATITGLAEADGMGLVVFVGEDDVDGSAIIVTSADLVAFTPVVPPPAGINPTDLYLTGVGYASDLGVDGRLVAAGGVLFDDQAMDGYIVWSDDGSTWARVQPVLSGPVYGHIPVYKPAYPELVPGSCTNKSINVIMILDVSGSMDELIPFNDVEISRLGALKLAVADAIDGLEISAAVDARLALCKFSLIGVFVGVYDLMQGGVLNAAEKTRALDDIDTIDLTFAGSLTNYEGGFRVAAEYAGNIISRLAMSGVYRLFDCDNTAASKDGLIYTNYPFSEPLDLVLMSAWDATGTVLASIQSAGGDYNQIGLGTPWSTGMLRLNFESFIDFDAGGPYFDGGSFVGVSDVTKIVTGISNANFGVPTTVQATMYFRGGGTEVTAHTTSGDPIEYIEIAGTGGNADRVLDYIELIPTVSAARINLVFVMASPPYGPLAGADQNICVFLSDGIPNRVYDGQNLPQSRDTQECIDQCYGLGEEGTLQHYAFSEIGAILDAGFALRAVGINVNEEGLAVLDLVDEAGDAYNIFTAEQLIYALPALAQCEVT